MKPKFFLASILSITLFFSCQKDSINEDLSNQNNFIVKEGISSNNNLRSSLDEPCITIDLIAGQNDIVGTVTIDRKLITGASPLASNNLGKLAANTLLEALVSK